MWRSRHKTEHNLLVLDLNLEANCFSPDLYQSSSCCQCLSRLYPKLAVFEHIKLLQNCTWLNLNWMENGNPCLVSQLNIIPSVLVQYETVLLAEEQSESSVGLQRRYMIIGCGAIWYSIVIHYKDRSFSSLTSCTGLLHSPSLPALWSCWTHLETTPCLKKCNEASLNKLQQSQWNMIAWENMSCCKWRKKVRVRAASLWN